MEWFSPLWGVGIAGVVSGGIIKFIIMWSYIHKADKDRERDLMQMKILLPKYFQAMEHRKQLGEFLNNAGIKYVKSLIDESLDSLARADSSNIDNKVNDLMKRIARTDLPGKMSKFNEVVELEIEIHDYEKAMTAIEDKFNNLDEFANLYSEELDLTNQMITNAFNALKNNPATQEQRDEISRVSDLLRILMHQISDSKFKPNYPKANEALSNYYNRAKKVITELQIARDDIKLLSQQDPKKIIEKLEYLIRDTWNKGGLDLGEISELLIITKDMIEGDTPPYQTEELYFKIKKILDILNKPFRQDVCFNEKTLKNLLD